MSCHLHRHVLLDLERGIRGASKPGAAAEAHVGACRACREWLDDQRQLSAGLRALGQATVVPDRADMEARLESAFGVYHAIVPKPRRFSAWGRWAAAAAALCAVSVGVWQFRAATVSRQTTATVTNVPAGRVAGGSPAAAPSPPAVAPAPPRPVVRLAARTATLLPFVPIPAAVGLPPLESAQVFRVQLPVEALPAYGFDIAPEATGSPVTADVLVGQDGQPRAIRLVTSEEQSGSKR